jgi:hypothetical protein
LNGGLADRRAGDVRPGRGEHEYREDVFADPTYRKQPIVPAARRTDGGTTYVSARRVCEGLDPDLPRRLAKPHNHHWPTVGMITTVGRDGKVRGGRVSCRSTSYRCGWWRAARAR